jgi:acyl-CoA-dependent ceramide synthase
MWYYYVQLAFWLQQIFVLHIEAPRKDFWALLAHHTVTLLLISGSALSNFWRAGNVVFVVMDLADIILAVSLDLPILCFFSVFICHFEGMNKMYSPPMAFWDQKMYLK